jgi:hypothetical protein
MANLNLFTKYLYNKRVNTYKSVCPPILSRLLKPATQRSCSQAISLPPPKLSNMANPHRNDPMLEELKRPYNLFLDCLPLRIGPNGWIVSTDGKPMAMRDPNTRRHYVTNLGNDVLCAFSIHPTMQFPYVILHLEEIATRDTDGQMEYVRTRMQRLMEDVFEYRRPYLHFGEQRQIPQCVDDVKNAFDATVVNPWHPYDSYPAGENPEWLKWYDIDDSDEEPEEEPEVVQNSRFIARRPYKPRRRSGHGSSNDASWRQSGRGSGSSADASWRRSGGAGK